MERERMLSIPDHKNFHEDYPDHEDDDDHHHKDVHHHEGGEIDDTNGDKDDPRWTMMMIGPKNKTRIGKMVKVRQGFF